MCSNKEPVLFAQGYEPEARDRFSYQDEREDGGPASWELIISMRGSEKFELEQLSA